jgi:radical SAM protein with 4Fe4S-binding SPASM domain
VTNASLLTPETSDMLLDARLDCLMISLQGISGDQYYKTSGVRIDYSGLIEQISYFYTRKSKRQGKQCRVILKIMDEMIPTPKDREVFSEIFGGIADELTVDSVMPTGGLVDDDHFRFKKNRFGDPVRDARVCAQPFYTVILDYDGSCYPCCQLENPPWLGNAAKSDFLEIWNAGAHFKLLKALLERRLDAFPRCVQCDLYKYMIAESDVLDGYEDEILNRLDSHE